MGRTLLFIFVWVIVAGPITEKKVWGVTAS